jgi:hypothetical protein
MMDNGSLSHGQNDWGVALITQPHLCLAAVPPGNEPTLPIEKEAGWVPYLYLEALQKRQVSCPYKDLNLGSSEYPAHRLVTILTVLSSSYEVL